MSRGVFLVSDHGLIEMSEQGFASEDILQDLLARYPRLLPGDDLGAEPRRWLFIAREHPIADQSDAGGRWSLDHLYLDQDGIPTLIEVKRSTDTRIRREVVGQMLDYAANATAYWRLTDIQAAFAMNCGSDDPDTVLRERLALDDEVDAYWDRVSQNLATGRLRLVFVADQIPRELRRIVEYLNEQMTNTEVLAVEVRQYLDDASGAQTLVPQLIGQTEHARTVKERPPRRSWDRQAILETISVERGAEERRIAEELFAWGDRLELALTFGKGAKYGYCHFGVKDSERGYCYPFALQTAGYIELAFATMASAYPPFQDVAERRGFAERLTGVTTIAEERLDKYPSFRLNQLANESTRQEFLAAVEWALGRAKHAVHSQEIDTSA